MPISIIVGAAVLFTIVGVNAVPVAQQPRFEIENVTVYSVFDGKVVTNTEYLEDPGHYDVYGTIGQTDEKLPEQRWAAYMYEDSTFSVRANGGQFLNTFSTYKPCPSCFSANENWMIGNVSLNNQGPISNSTGLMISTWTNLCLTNPGDGYLTKGRCNANDPQQLWNIVWSQ